MSTAPTDWQTPKTNWVAGDVPNATDFNRIESNVNAIEVGSRTIDPNQTPTGNSGSLRQFLDWLANRIKTITGKTNWWDAPDTTLAAAKAHADAVAPHSGHALTSHTHTRSQITDFTHKSTHESGGSDAITNLANGAMVAGNIIWHAGNDGAGSGLDADLVRGLTGDFIQLAARLSGALSPATDGDVVISSNASLPYPAMFYNNLTINAGVTLSGVAGTPCLVVVRNTLTLNGTLSVAGLGAAEGASAFGSGAGGAGGGILIVIAGTIVGSGTITAAGLNGGNGSTSTAAVGEGSVGYPGTDGKILGLVLGKGGPGYVTGSPGTGGSVSGTLRRWLHSRIIPFLLSDFGAAGGGSGASDNDSNYSGYVAAGGGGGAGAVGNGGNGGTQVGTKTASWTGTGGGGGGGGGVILLFSRSSLPAISVVAKGGNGGACYGQAGGGGGGGGGFVYIAAPGSSATVNVSGGSAGASYSSFDTPAQAGGAGLALYAQT